MSENFLTRLPPVVIELGTIFHQAGFELALVGGPVRDILLQRKSPDLDFTTNARPAHILRLITQWADATWETGRDFGTIALRKNHEFIEITTYRTEAYDADSRKPHVAFGHRLEDDVIRRDFTINAMAIRLPTGELVDIVHGRKALQAKILETPGTAKVSLTDDPLRMMRAARFVSQLDFKLSDNLHQAISTMKERLTIVSKERIRDELIKLMCGKDPVAGIEVLRTTGLLQVVLPEVHELHLTQDLQQRHKDIYQHTLTVVKQSIDQETDADAAVPAPDFVLRFAALMHDIGKPPTRKFEAGKVVSFHHHDVVGAKMTKYRMRELRFDNDTIKKVARLVELHLRFFGYADSGWSDAAIRRYIADAGPLLEHLHRLTRADVTTRNRRKAERLAWSYDELENRILQLQQQEKLDAIRPELDGKHIMKLLDLAPGPIVGKAYKYMLEVRMEYGPLPQEEAVQHLMTWWRQYNE